MREMVKTAFENPVGIEPFREILKKLKLEKEKPKVILSFRFFPTINSHALVFRSFLHLMMSAFPFHQ